MPREDSWTAEWCCEKLISHSNITEASPTGPNKIRINVEEILRPISVATISLHHVDMSKVPDSFFEEQTEFLLNVSKDAYVHGDVLQYASNIPVGIGGLGDLYTAANEKEFRRYISQEARFILRGLTQHSSVESVQRFNNRIYSITRYRGSPVTVLALNDYDLTADAIRAGIEKYGRPTFVLASNPNCSLTSAASAAAKSADTSVLKWRQLLGALNN